ncbi:AAA family ATPase [Aminipila butyrica]|uniref:AAA family ATPase n=1 Tax=Aminipila butyrica TaxID=433296 RepID=A0A858BUW8_9FIRM|nr:sigma 54-interacting transcriptional regulator [Aminipila butyrica]QIB69851.1 AAA family ATPase [Aminipila butyrica]
MNQISDKCLGGHIKRKKLAIVAGSEATKETLCQQMRQFLADCVDIQGYSEEIPVQEPIKADLVVMSSKILAEEMAGFVEAGCPVLIVRRSLNVEHIEKLFGIPKGTSVYFVNDLKENAHSCIEALKEIGIDYLDLIPYYPGCRVYKKADMAITAGELALVPESVGKVIDLGARSIDISSIVEILQQLDLMEEKLSLVSENYKENMVRFSSHLYHLFDEAANMNQYLGKILNQINDGIIAYYGNGILSIFNEKSRTMFGPAAAGDFVHNLAMDRQIKEYLLSKEDMSDRLFRLDHQELIFSKVRIEKIDTTVCTIKNAKENKDIEVKLRQDLIRKGYIGKYRFTDIVGSSPVMQEAIHIAKKLAKSDLNLLIYGESGVGKELFASAIHNESLGNRGPFVAINFSALPEELAESELFGYEEGAFTGAKKGGRLGIFEQANQGTIFLDEIGDVSPRIQARLLRVLQEKEIRRVGGSENIPIDVRVIAATNKDLVQMCREGQFREDLYHRLKNFYLKVPPLCARREDIDLLVNHFLQKHGCRQLQISAEVMELLRRNPWRGNVRELENVVEYLMAVCDSGIVETAHLPEGFFEDIRSGWEGASGEAPDKDLNRYTESLWEKGNLAEYLFFLNLIKTYTDKGCTISRRTMTLRAREQFPYLTEERVRKKTDDLQELKLITKSVGRVGMRLTINGMKYIEYNNQFAPIYS